MDRAAAGVGAPRAGPDPRVLAEQVRMIVAQTPQGVAAPAAMALILAAVAWDAVPRPPVVAVLALLFAVQAWWLAYYVRYRRADPPATQAHAWARGMTLRAAAHGACWGAYSLALFPSGSATFQSLDVAFMYGLVAGAVVVDGPHLRTFLAFAVPTLGPVIVRCLLEGTVTSVAAGAAGLVGLAQSIFAARHAAGLTETAIRARFENQDLLAAVQRQGQAADRARAEAEAANLGKSRFLAAASHDLRQPMHALGLLAAAARHAGSEAERGRIVDTMAASVDSLGALFDSLLEVSRLDAGTLQPRVAAVPLAGLLRGLEAEFAPEARARQLALRLHCRDLCGRSDPLLLERILRNLVANALRYTPRGGVLLSCRKRGGFARLEVWDTGVGIEPHQQAQVFEAFYQVGNPERDRRNGVGLGLAIVERLAGLLGHPLRLHSRPGRGSRFGIDVPLAPASHEARAAAGEEARLPGVVVALIDDDAAILEAMGLVLRQFGCVVVAGASGAELIGRLRAGGVEPDLVLVDQRLRAGELGTQAIASLRTFLDRPVPAIVITGDTAPGQLAAIRAAGFDVLAKPVSADALRRALARQLA
ncbi:MAG TPA: hybrid sensor histidine kinase/response regulator [Burkholderiales bacterium]|nr:hybrid sensor histidine kinase/response regulator [Burkholderiales bacterium]